MTVSAKPKLLKKLKSIKQHKNWSGLNVYILSFDSISQMEFRRNAPKTVDYLENVMKTNIFNGIIIIKIFFFKKMFSQCKILFIFLSYVYIS